MTRQELDELFTAVCSLHPRTFKTTEQMKATADGWFFILRDYDYKQCMIGLKSFEAQNLMGVFPAVGQIINATVPLQVDETYMGEGEAWSMYQRAIQDSTYHAEDWFKRFPPELKRAVGSPNALQQEAMNENFSLEVCRGQFLASYREAVKSLMRENRMPEEVRRRLHDLHKKSGLLQESNVRLLPAKKTEEDAE